MEQCIVDLTYFIEFNFSRHRLFNVNFTCVDDLTIRTHYFNTATTSEKALKYDVTITTTSEKALMYDVAITTTSEKTFKYDVTTTTSEKALK